MKGPVYLQTWLTARVSCFSCGHEWVAVYMLGTIDGECSQCGDYTPLPQLGEPPQDERVN